MYAILRNNLEIVYLIYGLAFFTMGVAIFAQTLSNSRFKLAGILGFLGWFGLTHGINEWLDSLEIIKGQSNLLDIVQLCALSISFVFLFEFGRHIFRLEMQTYSAGLKKIAGLLTWAVTPAIIIVVCIISVFSQDSLKTAAVWTRHLLAFPGGVLSCVGFILYYKYEEHTFAPLKVKKYFFTASIAFLAYAILAGLIVNKSQPGALNWFDAEYFFLRTSIPIQVFRAIVAIFIGWSAIGLLRIFRLEIIRKLEEMNERKSDFVARVSHELINPLAVIKESMSLILDGISGAISLGQREVLEAGKKSMERLMRLVTDLLDISKIEAGKMELKLEEIDLKQFANGLLITYEKEISKKKLILKKDVQKNIGLAWADKDKLTEVIINLLSNAIKYTPSGTITIKFTGDERDVRFEITDTGPGIPAEYHQKIFDKFERIFTNKAEGAGLGLSIAKDIIELHKGKIWVESKTGGGSKFIFTLPRGPRR